MSILSYLTSIHDIRQRTNIENCVEHGFNTFIHLHGSNSTGYVKTVVHPADFENPAFKKGYILMGIAREFTIHIHERPLGSTEETIIEKKGTITCIDHDPSLYKGSDHFIPPDYRWQMFKSPGPRGYMWMLCEIEGQRFFLAGCEPKKATIPLKINMAYFDDANILHLAFRSDLGEQTDLPY